MTHKFTTQQIETWKKDTTPELIEQAEASLAVCKICWDAFKIELSESEKWGAVDTAMCQEMECESSLATRTAAMIAIEMDSDNA